MILVTNLRDEDDEELLGAVKRLGRQHRVLVASLREEVLDTLRHEPVARYEQTLAYTGTIDYLNARNGLHEKLAAHGVSARCSSQRTRAGADQPLPGLEARRRADGSDRLRLAGS